MTAEALGDLLAPVNAALNICSAVLLILGFYFIRTGEKQRHQGAMLGAVTASALFLVFYLTRYSLTGTHEFAGEGPARTIYLAIDQRDYALVMAGTFFFATMVVIANLIADLLYAVVDPRIRYE